MLYCFVFRIILINVVLYCIARNLTSGKQTDLILLDFSKAFEGVNHLKLLYKLQLHDVQGRTLGWIESFIIGRTQCVVFGGDSFTELPVRLTELPVRLTELPVSYGVPQGPVSDLIFFVLLY